MRLIDLEPEWIADASVGEKVAHRRDGELTIATAQGVIFDCPSCFRKNHGLIGTHSILVWFRGRGVPADRRPGPGRWDVSGSGFGDLTLSPSVDISMGQPGEWHGFIRGGVISDA